MKKYLLPNMGNYYKANMHCHSTCSDGDYFNDEGVFKFCMHSKSKEIAL